MTEKQLNISLIASGIIILYLLKRNADCKKKGGAASGASDTLPVSQYYPMPYIIQFPPYATPNTLAPTPDNALTTDPKPGKLAGPKPMHNPDIYVPEPCASGQAGWFKCPYTEKCYPQDGDPSIDYCGDGKTPTMQSFSGFDSNAFNFFSNTKIWSNA